MDKKRSVLNVSISFISRITLLFASFFVRRLLIKYLGNDANGLNSLYTSIIVILNLAELGVGNAISYSMYKPIVEGDRRQVAALYGLYKRLYQIIGGVIFGAGLLVMPFLPHFISDYQALDVNIYFPFFLTLISVVLTYLYGAKTSLIMAHKDDYITTGILTMCRLVGHVLQTFSILIFRSFSVYSGCQIVETFLVWGMTERVVRKRHGEIVKRQEEVDRETRLEISRNVRAMCMHKIGGTLAYTLDNVIISTFIGVVILGKYSNYTLIVSSVSGTIALCFTSLTSVIGHLCAGENRAEIKRTFHFFYYLNYVLGVIFFHGYFAVSDSVIRLLFGEGLEISRSITFVISLNAFIQYMRSTTLLFRDATATYYYDRWKPLAEGLTNLGLSLLFVHIFPEEYRVAGVIVATIITSLLIGDVVEPYVIFKYIFGESVKRFWLKNYFLTALFTGSLFVLTYILRPVNGVIKGIFGNGLLSVAVSLLVLGLVSLFDKNFRQEIRVVRGKICRVINIFRHGR